MHCVVDDEQRPSQTANERPAPPTLAQPPADASCRPHLLSLPPDQQQSVALASVASTSRTVGTITFSRLAFCEEVISCPTRTSHKGNNNPGLPPREPTRRVGAPATAQRERRRAVGGLAAGEEATESMREEGVVPAAAKQQRRRRGWRGAPNTSRLRLGLSCGPRHGYSGGA